MILVVGLSPAWQRTLEYERFVVGKVNRAKQITEIASGKGVNVVRVAQQLGAKARLLTVAGGRRGALLKKSRVETVSATGRNRTGQHDQLRLLHLHLEARQNVAHFVPRQRARFLD